MTDDPEIQPAPAQDPDAVRARLIEKIATLHDLERLEFLELVVELPEYPFTAEVGLEVLLSVAGYIATAREVYERFEKHRGDGGPPGMATGKEGPC